MSRADYFKKCRYHWRKYKEPLSEKEGIVLGVYFPSNEDQFSTYKEPGGNVHYDYGEMKERYGKD